MAHKKVRIEWRKGETGTGGTFVFSTNPFLTRPAQGKRTATLTVPLLDGVILQELGLDERTIRLRGTLFNKTNIWDDMEVQRNELINGFGFGPGQLHIISPQVHLQYNAQIATNGINFDEQQFGNLQNYTINLRVPGAFEFTVAETTQTVNSDTDIT